LRRIFHEKRNSGFVNRLDKAMSYSGCMTDSVARLYQAVLAASGADPATSRTAKLLSAGRGKVAKKLAEEAAEVVIDAMAGQPEAVVRESADLLYHLVVLWAHAGVKPDEVWAEMRRRELMFGIAEKLPKKVLQAPPPRKIVAIESGRVRKRR
jgi:phosphoribosyl-ATP pyrophosphohydrolase